MIDVITELRNYPVKLQIYDTYAESNDVREVYQVDLTELDNLERADIVVLAVPHDDFVKQGWKLISKLLQPKGGIVYDVKSVLDKNVVPDNVNLLRL